MPKRLKVRIHCFILLISGILITPALAQEFEVPRTEWGVPDFQAVWKHISIIPFERPRELGEKRFYTEEEALEIEMAEQQRFDEDNEPLDPNRPPPEVAESLPPIGNYDLFWREDAQFIPTINGEMRTSAIIDPPNGRMPEIMPGVMEEVRARRANLPGRNDGPEGRGLPERCLVGFGPTAGPVMQPVIYNSNLQFIQSPGYVTIVAEMVHDARIVPLDSNVNLDENITLWTGDSRGYFDGDTLVVETKNFSNLLPSFGRYGTGENKVLTERFTRVAYDTIDYHWTLEDPTTFTDTIVAMLPLTKVAGQLYEYGCHEGNYGMTNLLRGERMTEQRAAQAGSGND